MNPIKEAAEVIYETEKRVNGLSFRMDVSRRYVHITGGFKEFSLSRTIAWTDIETASVNPLTITINLIERSLIEAAK
jgi:hypothetical protein